MDALACSWSVGEIRYQMPRLGPVQQTSQIAAGESRPGIVDRRDFAEAEAIQNPKSKIGPLMPKILILDPIAQEGLDLLAKAPGIEHEVRTGLKGDALKKALAEFDGAICRSGVKITAESLEGNRRLQAIVRAGVGTDNIDKEAATRLGIVVMNTPAGNTLSTAEHTFTLMLALSRNIAGRIRG